MKVAVTYPPLRSEKGYPTLGQNRQFQWFNNPSYLYPVVPASAATLLKNDGFDVIWKDAIAEEMSWENYCKWFEREKPELAAIETKTPVIKQHWKTVSYLKALSPGTEFVLMGDHVTALPKESLVECPKLDYIITGGDYDFALLKLAKYLRDGSEAPKGIWFRDNGAIRGSNEFEMIKDLDDLPFVDRDLTKWRLYKEYNFKGFPYTYIMSGRDCPWHKCAFCSWTTLYPNFRVRSTENVLDEIGMLIEKYGVKEIFDDTGTFPTGKWLERFCDGMIQRGYNEEVLFSCNMRFDYITPERAKLMKKAGFRLLKLGLESANQETLDRLNKGMNVDQILSGCKAAKEAGLVVHLTMMVGHPWESKEQALRTLKLAKKLMISGDADVLQATVLIPYPGTPLYKEALENGWFRIDPKDYERYDMREPVLKTPMRPEEVMNICDRIYTDIFLDPRYILNRLIGIRDAEDVRFVLKGARAVLGHIKDFRGI